MKGYLLDTSTVSAYINPLHAAHATTSTHLHALETDAVWHICVVTYAELHYGWRLAREEEQRLKQLETDLGAMLEHRPLQISEHTAEEYAVLKATLAQYCIKNRKGKPPRWVEDWVDASTAQKLQADENDLWIAAVSLERDLILLSGDEDMWRLAQVEPRLRVINTRESPH